jgi:hypothetical protein
VAYQLDSKTVLRASFAQMYMSTSGNPESNSASQDISLGDSANGGWHAGGFAHYTSTFRNPYVSPGNITHYVRDTTIANLQTTNDSFVVSGFSRDTHQPYELTWSFGLQRELPYGFLVEANYSANHGAGLLAPDLISRFPQSLFTPGNAGIYGTMVDSPAAGQRKNPDPQQMLSRLMMAYPAYGPIKLLGANIGRSNYNSFNLRAERRLTQGIAILANYTYAKLLDNVGGPEATNDNSVGGGRGSKDSQSVDTIRDVYGLSPFDERHRLAVTFNLELPVGRGKHFLGHPDSAGKTALDYAIGGWEFSGLAIYRSGRPVVFGYGNGNINNGYGIEWTYGSYATSNTNLANPSFPGDQGVFYSTQDLRPEGMQGRFDSSKFLQPDTFNYGTLPPVYGNIRNPGNTNYNISLMKRFLFTKDGGKYLQFRMEAINVFNIRGFGPYGTTVGNPDFGLITSAGNTERRVQMSARIVF